MHEVEREITENGDGCLVRLDDLVLVRHKCEDSSKRQRISVAAIWGPLTRICTAVHLKLQARMNPFPLFDFCNPLSSALPGIMDTRQPLPDSLLVMSNTLCLNLCPRLSGRKVTLRSYQIFVSYCFSLI